MLPKKRSLFLFFLVFSIIIASIYYFRFGNKVSMDPEPSSPKVEVIERKVKNFAKKTFFLAKLHSNKSIMLISETEGTIKSREFQIGDFVKKGQIILQMTDTRKVLELKELEDLLEASKARLDEASSNYKNSLKLHEKNIISDKEKETQWNLYRSYKFEYEAQKMRYKKVLWEFDSLSVRAPFDGYVNKYFFDVGQKISRGSTLIQFLDNNLLIGKANLSSENAEKIRGSKNPLIVKNKKFSVKAKLLGVGRQMSNDAPSYKLEFLISNNEKGFLPGEVVEVEIIISEYKNHISFPSSAIVMEEDNHYLFIVKDLKVKRIQIYPIQLDNKSFIVPETIIPPLYKIITNGQAKLQNNDKVRIKK
jgi:RND family efflux transporter MFP subunit